MGERAKGLGRWGALGLQRVDWGSQAADPLSLTCSESAQIMNIDQGVEPAGAPLCSKD